MRTRRNSPRSKKNPWKRARLHLENGSGTVTACDPLHPSSLPSPARGNVPNPCRPRERGTRQSATESDDRVRSTVWNPEAIAALPALSALDLQKTEGVTDISIFKDLPKLKYIYSKKGQFPEEQLAPFEKKAVVQ
jgi:hypothetical protein